MINLPKVLGKLSKRSFFDLRRRGMTRCLAALVGLQSNVGRLEQVYAHLRHLAEHVALSRRGFPEMKRQTGEPIV